jgi:hypothetical protein
MYAFPRLDLRRVFAFAGTGRLPFVVWAGVPSLVFLSVMWFPFGFAMGGLVEEWDMLYLFGKHGPHWSAFPGQPTSELFSARPLAPLPFFLAWRIDEASFAGFHVVLVFTCMLKALAGASIGRLLFRSRALAVLLGLLFLVYPADTQQVALRNIHINAAVALAAWAAVLAFRGLLVQAPKAGLGSIATAVVIGIAAVWIYEPVFALYVLFPLLVWARLGWRNGWRLVGRRRWVAALWVGGVSLNTIYLYYVLKVVRSPYQTALAGGAEGGLLQSIASNSGRLIEAGAVRTFVESWTSAWNIASGQTASAAYPLLIGCAVIAIMLTVVGGDRTFRLEPRRAARYLTAGLLAAVAGYLPYLVSVSHVAVTQRTFLGVALGAALIGTVLIATLARVFRVSAAFVAVTPLTLGLIAQAYQHDRYARAYVQHIEPYIRFVAARSEASKRVHLVVDASGVGGYLNGMYFTKLAYGLPVVRRAFDDVYVLCKDQPLSPISFFSNCRLENGRWVVSSHGQPPRFFDAHETHVIHVGADFASEPIAPSGVWRHRSAFEAGDSLFLPRAEVNDDYECVAESMWGYSGFCVGNGWSDGSVVREGTKTRSRFWAVSPEASLLFRMRPATGPYTLRVRFAAAPPLAITGRWSALLNREALTGRWLTPRLFEAAVPEGLLTDGLNELRFSGAVSPGMTTGLAIERVALTAAEKPSPIQIEPPPVLRPGRRYLCNDALSARVLEGGFSDTEHNGTWTDGPSATLRFLVPPTERRLLLKASVVPFLNEKHAAMTVGLFVKGLPAGRQSFSGPAALSELLVALPSELLKAGQPMEIRLELDAPASPEAIGAGQRWLGLFFKELEIVEDRGHTARREGLKGS